MKKIEELKQKIEELQQELFFEQKIEKDQRIADEIKAKEDLGHGEIYATGVVTEDLWFLDEYFAESFWPPDETEPMAIGDILGEPQFKKGQTVNLISQFSIPRISNNQILKTYIWVNPGDEKEKNPYCLVENSKYVISIDKCIKKRDYDDID